LGCKFDRDRLEEELYGEPQVEQAA